MSIIELLKVIILGIVEGITEWLPISSTGHMLLVDEFIQLNMSEEFKKMFFVVIQLGAIIAVIVLYWKKLWPFGLTQDKTEDGEKKVILVKKSIIMMWLKVIVACIPAGVIGILFDDWFDAHMTNPIVIALALIFYGVWFILIENKNNSKSEDEKKKEISNIKELSFKTALLIGVFQVLSLIPGTSRSGSTIIGGLTLGVSRKTAADFTFFLAIPVMFGASAVKLLKYGLAFSPVEVIVLLIGMIVAFGVSVFAIKFLMGYIKKHDFKVFGWYRIGLGIVVLLYFGIKALVMK